MIRTIGVVIISLCGLCVIGQNQTNPFDLKYRPAKPGTTGTVTVKKPDTAKSRILISPFPEKSLKIDSIPSSLTITDTFKVEEPNPNPFEVGIADDTNSLAVDNEVVEEAQDIDILPPAERKRPSRGIQIFLLLFSLLLLIFIVNVERSFVKDLWRVISNENYSSLHLRNQRNTMRQILLLMGYLVFIIQAGIFLYHALSNFNYEGQLFDNVGTCIALVLVIYLIRHSVIRYLRWLFNNDKEMTLFSFDISTFNIMVGLVLLPINVMLNFGPESLAKPLIIIGLVAIIGAYLMRQLRWMLTARQLITNSLFLFFVYLCAVEILPLWAILKFFW